MGICIHCWRDYTNSFDSFESKLVLVLTVDKNKYSGSLIRYLNPAVLRDFKIKIAQAVTFKILPLC